MKLTISSPYLSSSVDCSAGVPGDVSLTVLFTLRAGEAALVADFLGVGDFFSLGVGAAAFFGVAFFAAAGVAFFGVAFFAADFVADAAGVVLAFLGVFLGEGDRDRAAASACFARFVPRGLGEVRSTIFFLAPQRYMKGGLYILNYGPDQIRIVVSEIQWVS